MMDVLWDVLDKIGIATGIIALLVSVSIRVYLWRKEQRDNDLIHIRLQVAESDVLIALHGQIRRKNLTRAEVLGLLGMLPMRDEGKRYSLSKLSHPVFFAELEDAQVNGAVLDVTIPCSLMELRQFDFLKLREVCTLTGTLPDIPPAH